MSENFPNGTLVVVVDGTRGQMYRNRAGDGSLELENSGQLGPKELENDGPAGGRPAESSSQETDEATFAKQLAEYLYRHAQRGEYDALALLTDRQTLGQIRPSLHKEVQRRLMKELGKTLTNSPLSDIERSISSA